MFKLVYKNHFHINMSLSQMKYCKHGKCTCKIVAIGESASFVDGVPSIFYVSSKNRYWDSPSFPN